MYEDFPNIRINQEELQEALGYASLRIEENVGVSDSADYDGAVGHLPMTSDLATEAAVVGEWAVHKYLEVPTSNTRFFVTKDQYGRLKKAADLTWNGRKVEVRNCVSPCNPVKIADKDVAADAVIIQVHVEIVNGVITGRVYLIGWVEAAVAIRNARKKGSYHVKHIKNPMDTLVWGVAA